MNIDVEGISYQYPSGVEALRNVSLHVASKEAVAIIGENGAGKTTLAKHLNGLLRPSSGRVLIGDWITNELTVAQLSRRVGYVFQNPDDQLFARTVRAEVAFGPQNLGLDSEVTSARVEQALSWVDLVPFAEQHPYDLHASKRKLVAIAATLAMATPIVIFDEPTTGQDARGVGYVGSIVEGLKSEGRTVIVITHDLDFCAEHFDRVIVMSQGRVLLDDHADTVLSQDAILHQAGVERPQLIRLAEAIALSATPRTVDEFVQAWVKSREV